MVVTVTPSTGSPISWKKYLIYLAPCVSLGVVSGWIRVILSDFCELRCLPVREPMNKDTQGAR